MIGAWVVLGACGGPALDLASPPPERATGVVDLAGAWTCQGDGSALRCEARVPLDPEPARGVLVVEGVVGLLSVAINGQDLGGVHPGPGPSRIPLPPGILGTENLLSLQITAWDAPPVVTNGAGRPLSGPRASHLRVGPSLLTGLALAQVGPRVEARVEVGEVPAGSKVRAVAVLDGSVVGDLGEAPVQGPGQVRLPAVRWRAPGWTGSNGLVEVVVVLEDPSGAVLDLASWRTGAGRLTWTAPDLEMGGQPWPLLAVRADPDVAPGRQLLPLLAGGVNALEVHGKVPLESWFREADELGVPVVLMPRCDGRIWATDRERADGGPDVVAAWGPVLQEQDQDLAWALGPHPSAALWACEGSARSMERVCRDLDELDPADRPVVGRDMEGWPVFAGSRRQAGQDGPGWVLEVTAGTGTVEDLAASFWDTARVGHLGGVILPPPPRREGQAWDRTWSDVARRLQARPLPTEPRRGPSRVEVTGLGRGQVAWLLVPWRSPVAALADARGVATLEAWYEGEATVRVGEEHHPVTLVADRWERFQRVSRGGRVGR